MTQALPQTSLVIPVFNEEEGLAALLEEMTAQNLLEQYEVIVVNDGSTDQTAAVCDRFPVTRINHGATKGYGAAIKTGIRAASGEKVILLDGDGEHSCRYIPEINRLLEENDLVIGTRDTQTLRKRPGKIGRWLIRRAGRFLVEQPVGDFNSGYRGFRTALIRRLIHIMPNGYSFSTTSTLAFLREDYRVATLPIEITPRNGRASSVNFFSDGAKTFLLLLRTTMLFNPLKVFFPASLLFCGTGFFYGLTTVILYQQLFKSAMTLLFFGITLFFVGLLADQIAMLNRK